MLYIKFSLQNPYMYCIIIMVIIMMINVIIEPEYKDTVWCRETLCGIEKKAASLRYRTKIYSYDALNADIENIIIVGTSPHWVSTVLQRASALGICPVTVSCQPLETQLSGGYVLIDHDSATKKCIQYLKMCKRKNIALYGINRNSYADMIKTKYFDDKNIFYSFGKASMMNCYAAFFQKITSFDAVICSNYISAIHLMHMLKHDGISVPNDLYVAAYGDSVIGNMFSPTLTTVTLNHGQLGIQAVNLCRSPDILTKNSSVTIRVPSEIHIAESTANTPCAISQDSIPQYDASNNIFKDDKLLLEIQSLEKVLRICDSKDFNILCAMLENKPYIKIGDLLYMSESTVKYRVKRLLTAGNIKSSEKLLELYKKYVGADDASIPDF